MDDHRLDDYQVRPCTFTSADEHPREHSPEGWLPQIADVMAYDDEIDDAPIGVWFLYFAGGSSRLHFFLRDGRDDFFYIEAAFGYYTLNGVAYHNVYDAFWLAEQAADLPRPDDHDLALADAAGPA